MIKSFKSILLSFIAFIAIAALLPEKSYAEWGANIVGANCNPGADPVLDYQQTDATQRSCVGQGIKMNDFKVRVHFKGDTTFKSAYGSAATLIIAYAAAAGGPIAQGILLGDCLDSAMSNDIYADVGVGTKVGVGSTCSILGGGSLIDIEARIEGDKVCVYGSTPFPLMLNLKASRTDGFNASYGIDAATTTLPSHCMFMPLPIPASKPSVPTFISDTCRDYDTTASQFKWPQVLGADNQPIKDPQGNVIPGKTRSFTGVVVQCVEETMQNLFFNPRGANNETVFIKTQKRLGDLVMAMLVLHIIFIGLKYAIWEKGGMKRKEFIWIPLKIGLVMYFATGAGMTDLLPGVIGSMKNLSAIMVDAVAGPSVDQNTGLPISQDSTKAALVAAADDYKLKRDAYSRARKMWGDYVGPTVDYPDYAARKEDLKDIMDAAKEVQDEANGAFERARISNLSFGYDYCNFQPFVNAGKYNYNFKKENGTYEVRDMSYMHLWDSIDCRLAKYLGIGANADSPSHPQILLIAIGSLFGSIFGPIIFTLIITFLVFVILITVRMVHIYIIAYIALVLLAYIAPLAVPMVLFEYTKSSFDAWMKQFIGFFVQPLVLFAFLAFMFAIFDTIVFGDNFVFEPANKTHMVTNLSDVSARMKDHSIHKIPDRNDPNIMVCPDQDALGCIYENLEVEALKLEISGATLIQIYRTQDIGENHMKDSTAIKLVAGLMKIVFVSFIVHAMLGQAEEMSRTLTNVLGGAAAMSGAPTMGATSIASKAVQPLKLAGKLMAGAGKIALKQTAGRAIKSARRSELRSARESK